MKSIFRRYGIQPIAVAALVVMMNQVFVVAYNAQACPHITLKGADGTMVSGRAMEWAGFDMKKELAVVAR